MTQINLLPWREELRQIQKTQFLTMLITVIVFTMLIFLIIHLHYRGIYRHQQALNAMISAAINAEQAVLNQLGTKATDAIEVENQLKFIISLYNDNYGAVRLLNEMTEVIPSSIALDQIKRNGKQMTLSGIAKSEDDVTRLMNDIAKSPYYNQPVLASMTTDKNKEEHQDFTIVFEQKV